MALAAGTLLTAGDAGASEVVTRWTFNGATGTTSPFTGSGVASLVGGTIETFPVGSPTDKFAEDAAQNRAWSIGSFPANSTGSGTRGAMWQVATPADAGITITWCQRQSASSSRWTRFEYSIDGTNFTSDGVPNDGLLEATAGPDQWANDRSVDLSKIAGVAGNPNFAFRIVSVFAPGTQTYVPTGPLANYATSGTVRFDLMTVSATQVPGPGTASLLGAAAMALRSGTRPRRRFP